MLNLCSVYGKNSRSSCEHCAGSKGCNHPMLKSRPVKKTGYIVITSDRGLAGGL